MTKQQLTRLVIDLYTTKNSDSFTFKIIELLGYEIHILEKEVINLLEEYKELKNLLLNTIAYWNFSKNTKIILYSFNVDLSEYDELITTNIKHSVVTEKENVVTIKFVITYFLIELLLEKYETLTEIIDDNTGFTKEFIFKNCELSIAGDFKRQYIKLELYKYIWNKYYNSQLA